MRKEFKVHKLNEQGMKIAVEMADKFSDLADWVESVSDSSGNFKTFIKKLEVACFYAKKSMAEKPDNQIKM